MNASAWSRLLGGISTSVAGGNPYTAAQAGSSAASDWGGLLAGAAQITAVAVRLW